MIYFRIGLKGSYGSEVQFSFSLNASLTLLSESQSAGGRCHSTHCGLPLSPLVVDFLLNWTRITAARLITDKLERFHSSIISWQSRFETQW